MKTDTCTFKDCYFGGLLEKPEQCPNFMENWFYPKDSDPYCVKDCAPRRTLDILKDIHTRLIGVQKSHEQQRNASTSAFMGLAAIAKQISQKPNNGFEIIIPRISE